MAVAEGRVMPPVTPRVEVHVQEKASPPVVLWGAFGAVMLAFIVYVWVSWITGPYFERVPAGPSDPPTWMKAELIVQMVLCTGSIFALIGWFTIRPLVKQRRMTLDGMLMIIFFTFWFQDPLSAYTGHWFTYNAWMPNMGSWVAEVPGWGSFGEPGAMIPEPYLWTAGVYVWSSALVVFLGCWFMRKCKARWPWMTRYHLIAACFGLMVVVDLVLEAIIWMPLGTYQYPGAGHLAINEGTYYQFPIWEAPLFGAFLTGIACLRYFRNDKGETWAERGVSKIETGPKRKQLLRFLALLGAGHAMFLALYNIPAAMFVSTHTTEWPADIQKRSYFTDGICGDGTGRLCPGGSLPLQKGKDSYAVSPDGELIRLGDARLPGVVPFDRGDHGGKE